MRPKEKTRPREGAGRDFELICLAAINSEDSPALIVLQAAISGRRFGLTPATTAPGASLVFMEARL
jgi:hypothetical protein